MGSHSHPRAPGQDDAPAATSASEPGLSHPATDVHAPDARWPPPACPNHLRDRTPVFHCIAAGTGGTRLAAETADYAASSFRSLITHTECQSHVPPVAAARP